MDRTRRKGGTEGLAWGFSQSPGAVGLAPLWALTPHTPPLPASGPLGANGSFNYPMVT